MEINWRDDLDEKDQKKQMKLQFGTKKEDQDAMLAAQKLSNDAFAAAKTPPVQEQPSRSMQSYAPNSNSFGGYMPKVEPTFDYQPQVVTGFGGKPAPAPAPQPEL